MKNLISRKRSLAGRSTPLAVFAAALVAAVAAAAGLATQANAAQAVQAKLKHGGLTIKGTNASDEIALRLQAGDPGILELDVGDDGTADFSFERAAVATIAVGGRAATISSASTRTTAPSPTASRRQSTAATETTRSPAARGSRRCSAATETTRSTGTAATTLALHGHRRRHLRLGSRRRQRRGRRPGRHRHDALQRRQRRRAGRPVGKREPAQVLPRPRATSPWTPPASSASTSTPSAAPTTSPSTT